jgi:hypothetical protein
VKVVRAVIGRKLVGDVVEGEAAQGEPIGITADDRAEVRRLPFVCLEGVESKDDISTEA